MENFAVTSLEYLYVKKFVEYMRPRIPPIFNMTFKTFENSTPEELWNTGSWAWDSLEYGIPICKIEISFSKKATKKIKKKMWEFLPPDFDPQNCLVEFELLSNEVLYVFNNVFHLPDSNSFPSIRFALRAAFGPLAYKSYDWSPKNIPKIMQEWKDDWEGVSEAIDKYYEERREKKKKKRETKKK